jgi:hypothetical protein
MLLEPREQPVSLEPYPTWLAHDRRAGGQPLRALPVEPHAVPTRGHGAARDPAAGRDPRDRHRLLMARSELDQVVRDLGLDPETDLDVLVFRWDVEGRGGPDEGQWIPLRLYPPAGA